MKTSLAQLRPVRVVGIGLHPYQKPDGTPYTQLGVHAIRGALADAKLQWPDIDSAYTGTATTSMALSRLMYRHLGATGIPMSQVENASASGSTAFRQACIDVASGLADVAIAVGVDKCPYMRGGRGDLHAVLGEHSADRGDPEPILVSVDVINDHRSRRSTSAAAKHADAVFKISLALRNSAFSLRSAANSASCSPTVIVPRAVTIGRSFSIQFRNVAWLISSNAPTCSRAASLPPPCSARWS